MLVLQPQVSLKTVIQPTTGLNFQTNFKENAWGFSDNINKLVVSKSCDNKINVHFPEIAAQWKSYLKISEPFHYKGQFIKKHRSPWDDISSAAIA